MPRLAALAFPLYIHLGCSGTGPAPSDSGNAGGSEAPSSTSGVATGGSGTASAATTRDTPNNEGGSGATAVGDSSARPSSDKPSSGGASAAESGKGQNGGNTSQGSSAAARGGTSSMNKNSTGQGGKGSSAGASKTTGGSASTSKTTIGGSADGGATTGSKSTSAGSVGGSTNGACVESSCGSHKWPCWRMPNPATLSLPNPQSYTDLGNGTVRDNVTCLTWEKANPATKSDLEGNLKRCAELASSSYAGYDDWRLPTRVEMASITDVTRGNTGYPAAFTVTGGYYATGSLWYKTILTDKDSTSGNEVNRVWGYGTNGFTSNAIVLSDQNMVARCVRGNGSGEALDEYAAEPPDHYTVTGAGKDAVVKDNYTGLIWQQTYSSARMPWAQASSYCDEQTTGGLSNWRVPTLNELASTVNEALVAPAINRTVFPSTNGSCDPDGWFWAAEASKIGGTAWGLSYCDGYTGANSGKESSAWNYFVDGWVRCVHD